LICDKSSSKAALVKKGSYLSAKKVESIGDLNSAHVHRRVMRKEGIAKRRQGKWQVSKLGVRGNIISKNLFYCSSYYHSAVSSQSISRAPGRGSPRGIKKDEGKMKKFLSTKCGKAESRGWLKVEVEGGRNDQSI